jgi:hypothetical protein
MYMDQIARDFSSFRLEKEKLILLGHLSQQQSMQLADAMEASEIQSVNRSKTVLARWKDMSKTYLNKIGHHFGTPYVKVKPLRASHRMTLTILQ